MDIISYYKEEEKWMDKDKPTKPLPKARIFKKKTMLCVSCDESGIIYHEFLRTKL